MILIKPSTEILSITSFPLELIEKAGRTCYKSEDKITENSNIDFSKMILKRGHESVIEHVSATVKFICDRGVSHEIVRHRIASYSQESTRYCDYNNGHVSFVIPPWVDIKPGIYKYGDAVLFPNLTESSVYWFTSMGLAEKQYQSIRNLGWKPEEARSVLPNSLKTEIIMTANIREWRHFFKLRTSPAAHPQMREIAIPLLEKFKNLIPIIFDNVE